MLEMLHDLGPTEYNTTLAYPAQWGTLLFSR